MFGDDGIATMLSDDQEDEEEDDDEEDDQEDDEVEVKMNVCYQE